MPQIINIHGMHEWRALIVANADAIEDKDAALLEAASDLGLWVGGGATPEFLVKYHNEPRPVRSVAIARTGRSLIRDNTGHILIEERGDITDPIPRVRINIPLVRGRYETGGVLVAQATQENYAERVVQAFNAHRDLVIALRDLLALMDDIDDRENDGTPEIVKARTLLTSLGIAAGAEEPPEPAEPELEPESELPVGTLVSYRGGWGNRPPVLCTITGQGEKNGKTVYDNSLGHWGYRDQYEKVAP